MGPGVWLRGLRTADCYRKCLISGLFWRRFVFLPAFGVGKASEARGSNVRFAP